MSKIQISDCAGEMENNYLVLEKVPDRDLSRYRENKRFLKLNLNLML
jgi:hypothetical protein